MAYSTSDRRKSENEMVFRRLNENIITGIEEIDAMYFDDKNSDMTFSPSTLLHFMCECSDENCTGRIQMTLQEYKDIHNNRKAFMIKPGHEVKQIEKVVSQTENYSVVIKYQVVPEPSSPLHKTDVDNTKK